MFWIINQSAKESFVSEILYQMERTVLSSQNLSLVSLTSEERLIKNKGFHSEQENFRLTLLSMVLFAAPHGWGAKRPTS